tara:strand:+ start:4138 stop:4980 length:843 start_codon:yes stop_codon:yes gene_type:complete
MKDFDHHPSIEFSRDIKDICAPLHEHLEITFFDFRRIYNDERRLRLSSHADWTTYYLNNEKLINRHRGDTYLKNLNKKYIICDHWPNNDATFNVLEQMRNFNIDHVFSLIKKFDEYIDCYVFGTNPQNANINDKYLQYIDFLNHFCEYFVVKAYKIIEKTKTKSYALSSHKKARTFNNYVALDENLKIFLEKTKIQNLIIKDKDKNEIMLPRRESEATFLLLEGYSIKEIARKMNISPCTVEATLRKILEKTKYAYKNDLKDSIMRPIKKNFFFHGSFKN